MQELVSATVDLQIIYLLIRSHLANSFCDAPQYELINPTSILLDGQLEGIPN